MRLRFYARVLSTGRNQLQWMPHIQVADVTASVQRALALGGSVLMDARADNGTILQPRGFVLEHEEGR